MESLFESILSPKVITLALSMVALMFTLGRAIPVKGKKLNQTSFWKRWGAIILGILCVGGAFMPTENSLPLSQWGSTIQIGLTAGMLAIIGRKLVPQKLLERIEGKKKEVEEEE